MSLHKRTALIAAALLVLATVALGAWVLAPRDPGSGAEVSPAHHAGMVGDAGDHHMDGMRAHHGYMVGASSRRGALGGWLGLAQVLLVLAFLGLLALLLVPALGRLNRRPQPGACPRCLRPVELDWSICPFCEARLDTGPDRTEPGEAP